MFIITLSVIDVANGVLDLNKNRILNVSSFIFDSFHSISTLGTRYFDDDVNRSAPPQSFHLDYDGFRWVLESKLTAKYCITVCPVTTLHL